MLELTNLSKRFKAGNYGVHDVSLAAASGVLGLLGPNGAGKTTLMQMVATVTKPTTGILRFQGTDVLARPETLRRRLGYLPQDFGIYEELTAREHLAYFAALKGVSDRRKLDEMLELVNLHGVAHRPVGGFSGGMKQRLGIAQALVNDPDLLIVDEPTVGLDPEERLRFRTLLAELGGGKLVILSTHVVPDVESIATRIAVMSEGRLLTCDTADGLIAAARGEVWEAVATDADYERLRGLPAISRSVRKDDGLHLRFVGVEPPLAGARPVEPSLEDAYLRLVRGQRGAEARP